VQPIPHRIYLWLAQATLGWFVAYNLVQPLANWFSYTLMSFASDSRLGQSLTFFLYDVPKILLLLSGMIFLISWIM